MQEGADKEGDKKGEEDDGEAVQRQGNQREHRGEHQRGRDYFDFAELVSAELREHHVVLMHRTDS